MDPSSSFYAGGSESKITVTVRTLYSTVQPVTITTNGYSSVRFLIKMNDGSIILENYTYGLNAPEIFDFVSAANKSIGQSITTVYDFVNINFTSNFASFSSVSGIIKKNSEVIGEFTKAASTGFISYKFYSDNANILVKNGDIISLVMNAPLFYSKTLSVNRLTPDVTTELSNSLAVSKLSVGELITDKKLSNSLFNKNTFLNLFGTDLIKISSGDIRRCIAKYINDDYTWLPAIPRGEMFWVSGGAAPKVFQVSTLLANDIRNSTTLTFVGVSNPVTGTVTYDPVGRHGNIYA